MVIYHVQYTGYENWLNKLIQGLSTGFKMYYEGPWTVKFSNNPKFKNGLEYEAMELINKEVSLGMSGPFLKFAILQS